MSFIAAAVLAGGACDRARKPQRVTETQVASIDAGLQTAAPVTGGTLAPIELSNAMVDRALVGLRDFSTRLTREVLASSTDLGDNAAFSPASVALALGMLAASAEPATQLRLSGSLGLAPDELHRALHWLQLNIAQAGADPQGTRCDGCNPRDIQQAVFANGTWFQSRPLRVELRNTLVNDYAADIAVIAPSIREDMRAWVDQRTLGLIPDFRENVKPDDLSEFVNVLYLSAQWQPHFDTKSPFTFTSLKQRPTRAKAFRSVWSDGKYLGTRDYEAFTVSYARGALEALIVLPRAGRFEAVSQMLGAGTLVPQDLLRSINGDTLLDVTMPEFEANSRIGELAALLNSVTDNALRNGRFAYYAGQPFGSVEANAVQRVYVRVNEKGTQAAAATLISTATVSARTGKPKRPPVPIVVRVERPFFFFVRTAAAGAVVFVARVAKPVEWATPAVSRSL